MPGQIVLRFADPDDPADDVLQKSSFESQYGVSLGESVGPYTLAYGAPGR